MYLTHFGRIKEVERLAGDLRKDINKYADLARQYSDAENRKQKIFNALKEYLGERLSNRISKSDVKKFQEFLTPDLELNTAGLEVWLNRLAKLES